MSRLKSIPQIVDLVSQDVWFTGYFKASNWLFFNGLDRWGRPLGAFLKVSFLALALFSLVPFKTYWSNFMSRFLALSMLSIWLMTSQISYWIWENIPILYKVQFPWRMGVILDFSIAFFMVLVLGHCRSQRKAYTILGICFAVFFAKSSLHLSDFYRGPFTSEKRIQAYQNYLKYRTEGIEYCPDWVPHSPCTGALFLSQPEISPAVMLGKVSSIIKKPGHVLITGNFSSGDNLIFKQFYFPSWKAHADHSFLPVLPDKSTGYLSVNFERPIDFHKKIRGAAELEETFKYLEICQLSE